MQFHGVFEKYWPYDFVREPDSTIWCTPGWVIYVAVFTIFQNGHIDKFGHTRVGHVGQSCYFLKIKTDVKLGHQNGQICFWPGQRKNNYLSIFFLFLALKPFRFLYVAISGWQSTEVLRQVKKQHWKIKFWNRGPKKILNNLLSAYIISSKITPP